MRSMLANTPARAPWVVAPEVGRARRAFIYFETEREARVPSRGEFRCPWRDSLEKCPRASSGVLRRGCSDAVDGEYRERTVVAVAGFEG